MKSLRLYVLAATLLTASATALSFAPERSRLSLGYHKVCDKLSNHKGKVGLAAGVVGATIFNKVFSYEIDTHVKPLIKSVWKRTCNFFRRILKKEEEL